MNVLSKACSPESAPTNTGYAELASILVKKIVAGHLAVGSLLPTEHEIARHDCFSRHTVCATLSLNAGLGPVRQHRSVVGHFCESTDTSYRADRTSVLFQFKQGRVGGEHGTRSGCLPRAHLSRYRTPNVLVGAGCRGWRRSSCEPISQERRQLLSASAIFGLDALPVGSKRGRPAGKSRTTPHYDCATPCPSRPTPPLRKDNLTPTPDKVCLESSFSHCAHFGRQWFPVRS